MPGSFRKICVITIPEAEDALAELLERTFQLPATSYTQVAAGLSEVSVYLPAEGQWSARTKAELEQRIRQLESCGLNIGPGRIRVSRLRPNDWVHSWKKHFRPIRIGSRLLIKPSWSRRRPIQGEQVVVLDPGLSFGTGQHPTTLFCLQQLVAGRRAGRRQSMLDAGTGSGILAIAAAKLGYAPVEAFDFDPAALRVARANARRNQAGAIRFGCRDVARMPLRSPRRYSVICANLLADLLVVERRRILASLREDGLLVLAGILGQEFSKVRRAYEGEGMRLLAERWEGEWRSGSFSWRA